MFERLVPFVKYSVRLWIIGKIVKKPDGYQSNVKVGLTIEWPNLKAAVANPTLIPGLIVSS